MARKDSQGEGWRTRSCSWRVLPLQYSADCAWRRERQKGVRILGCGTRKRFYRERGAEKTDQPPEEAKKGRHKIEKVALLRLPAASLARICLLSVRGGSGPKVQHRWRLLPRQKERPFAAQDQALEAEER
jgi:hypothetical protein